MTVRYSTGLIQAILDSGLGGAFDPDGRIDIFTGAQPASADGAATGLLLGTLTMAADGIAPAAGRAVAWNAIASDLSADASGTAGWFRIYKQAEGSAGGSSTLRRLDGSCTGLGGGGEIQFDSVAFTLGGTIALPAFTVSAASWGPT